MYDLRDIHISPYGLWCALGMMATACVISQTSDVGRSVERMVFVWVLYIMLTTVQSNLREMQTLRKAIQTHTLCNPMDLMEDYFTSDEDGSADESNDEIHSAKRRRMLSKDTLQDAAADTLQDAAADELSGGLDVIAEGLDCEDIITNVAGDVVAFVFESHTLQDAAADELSGGLDVIAEGLDCEDIITNVAGDVVAFVFESHTQQDAAADTLEDAAADEPRGNMVCQAKKKCITAATLTSKDRDETSDQDSTARPTSSSEMTV